MGAAGRVVPPLSTCVLTVKPETVVVDVGPNSCTPFNDVEKPLAPPNEGPQKEASTLVTEAATIDGEPSCHCD